MQKLLLVGISVALTALAACGGSVVFVEDDDGNGGSNTTSSSVGPTGSKSSNVSSNTVTTFSVATSVGVTTSVTTGSGLLCEVDQMTPACMSCLEQAQGNGLCTDEIQTCVDDPDCLTFNDCIASCGGSMSCCVDCHNASQGNGVPELYEAVACLYCNACAAQCQNVLPEVCGF